MLDHISVFSSVWDFDPETWITIILRTALHHPSLLEGIFVLSALQFAHRSSRRHSSQQKSLLNSAYTHKENALSGLHDLQQHPGAADCGVLFRLYEILVAFEFASIQHFQSSSLSSALDDMSQIFHQLRASTTNLTHIVNKIREQKIAKKKPPALQCPTHSKWPYLSYNASMPRTITRKEDRSTTKQ